jgi:LmbE family N-acetylglucosaminyl deacetylase
MPLLPLLLLTSLLDPSPQPDAVELAHDLARLRETASVLYVAAHPDDENTQLLATLANERSWRVGYLSLTRGEGGQNAIGDELVHGLGLIRTWELLSARSVDGAEQWIGTLRDFGYSKSAEEALQVWGEDAALAEVVYVVRRLRPDVIVTRFPEEGSTHGHHLASARLARRAFELAGDPTAFPEQLEGDAAVTPWQPTRLLHNVPIRFMGGEIQDEWFTMDIGGYDALRGRSYGELAAESRSMHRSQAFGSAARRGAEPEPFALLAGSTPAGEDPFADIPSGWATRPGGEALAAALDAVAAGFDPRDPAASVPAMLTAYEATASLEAADAARARAGIEAWLLGAAGLFVDARVADPFVAPGAAVPVTVQVVARADEGWRVEGVTFEGAASGGDRGDGGLEGGGALERNVVWELAREVPIAADAPVTTPYWLRDAAGIGRYAVADRGLVGLPVGPPALLAEVRLARGEGPAFAVSVPVRAVRVDPLLGERVEPLTVLPPILVAPDNDVLLLPNGEAGALTLSVEASADVRGGSVSVEAPTGWTVTPERHAVDLAAGARAALRFEVTAPADAAPAALSVRTEVGERVDSWTRATIDYPHLPPLTMLLPAVVQAAPLVWTPPTGAVGYVMGPGDSVATALQAAGVDVRLLDDAALVTGDLSQYAAIVVGARAFHERAPLRTHTQRLWDYAAAGGVVVVQYQTNNRSQSLDVAVGPAPITIGRGRVTVEEAPMTWLGDGGGVRDGLHQLEAADFAGWVQERGLYFAESWDPAWTPLLEVADPGEPPQQGALLLMEHGEGAVFYVGLSLFRQLPAGVPGAYRLLANLIGWRGHP